MHTCTSNFSSGIRQTLESLWRCDLVNKVAVYVKQNGAIVLLVDDMAFEYLVVPEIQVSLSFEVQYHNFASRLTRSEVL